MDRFAPTVHVETVVLLGRKMVDAPKHVTIDYDVPTDINFTHSATYAEIKAWIQEHYNGMKVSSLYVAQIKDKHGLEKRENYNKAKKPDVKVPQCPPEKEEAIEAALKHFGMID